MKPTKQDRLLKDVLAGEELSDFRHASLDCALALVKRRRRQRRVLRACAMACLPLLLVLGVVLHRTVPQPPVEQRSSAPPVELNRVKFITDEELFALFPGRSMALIGKPGHQQLVFLDMTVEPLSQQKNHRPSLDEVTGRGKKARRAGPSHA